MGFTITDYIKEREIHFRSLNPAANDAREAIMLLMEINGIENITAITSNCIQVRYDIRHITLQVIETGLSEVGFHLDNNLLYKLRRALYEYTETTQRANLGLEAKVCTGNCAQKVFVQQYRSRTHGCRDERPQHWRRYL